MADSLPENFPEEAGNYVRTIDLQLRSITYSSTNTDYEHALVEQVAQLKSLRQRVIADPSIASVRRPPKRSAATDHDTVMHAIDNETTDNGMNDPDFDTPMTGMVDENNEDSHEPVTDNVTQTATPHRRNKRVRLINLATCSTCFEEHPVKETATLTCCSTVFCKPCFHAWFEAALSTKNLPKCCEVGIEPKDYPIRLTRPLMTRYKEVVKELDAERLLWCSNKDCRASIKINQDTSGFVHCTKCRRKTCASCTDGISAHIGPKKVCPNHLADEVLESAIEANEWKRCPKCQVVVEKNKGCNNIRCTCGSMFCFRCGDGKKREQDPCSCAGLY